MPPPLTSLPSCFRETTPLVAVECVAQRCAAASTDSYDTTSACVEPQPSPGTVDSDLSLRSLYRVLDSGTSNSDDISHWNKHKSPGLRFNGNLLNPPALRQSANRLVQRVEVGRTHIEISSLAKAKLFASSDPAFRLISSLTPAAFHNSAIDRLVWNKAGANTWPAAAMATVSPTQPISTITPPSSSHGGQISWDYAVPVDGDDVCSILQSILFTMLITIHNSRTRTWATRSLFPPSSTPTRPSINTHNP